MGADAADFIVMPPWPAWPLGIVGAPSFAVGPLPSAAAPPWPSRAYACHPPMRPTRSLASRQDTTGWSLKERYPSNTERYVSGFDVLEAGAAEAAAAGALLLEAEAPLDACAMAGPAAASSMTAHRMV